MTEGKEAEVLTNESGKDEYGWLSFVGFIVGAVGAGFPLEPIPSFPLFFNHCTTSGSLPPAQDTSTDSNTPLPDPTTAENASATFLNGMSAVAYFGGLVGFFLVGFIERTIDEASIEPNEERWVDIAKGVVRVGYCARGYFIRIVVSKGPICAFRLTVGIH